MTTLELRERLNWLKGQGLPFVILLSLFFGTSTIASRFVLREMNSISYIGIRMLISTSCFLILFAVTKRHRLPRDPKVWRHGFILGIIGTTLPMTGFITALTYLSAGVTSIISTIGPALTVTLAHFLLKDDRMNRGKILGVVMSLSGGLLLIMLGETGLAEGASANPLGYLFILGSTISSSFGVIYARRHVRDMSATEVTSVRALTAMLITLPLGIFVFGYDLPSLSTAAWAGIFYGSTVSTFVGFILSLWIISTFGVATSVMTNYMVPIIATIAGAIVLDEVVTPGMVVGVLIILSGIYIINSQTRRHRVPIPPVAKY